MEQDLWGLGSSGKYVSFFFQQLVRAPAPHATGWQDSPPVPQRRFEPRFRKPLPDPIPMKVRFPVRFALAASAPAASAGGFASRFDRKTLNDWRNPSTWGETKVVGYDVHFTIDPAPDGKLPHCSYSHSSLLPPSLRRTASCYRTSRPSRPHPTDE